MITFQKITYRNFLSAGNNPISIDLASSPTTLVVGANGTGKSSIEEAISFALFNKPYREVKKNQLINTVNGRECEVTLDFIIGPTSYRVVRGIKPNKFEIWRDGKLLNQESDSRDYQKILEQGILKLNYKSFHQIVVLGSSSFIPFMRLSTGVRREVIEDLLDIGVFTRMNQLLKERVSKLREKLGAATGDCQVLEHKIQMQKRHVAAMRGLDQDRMRRNAEKISELNIELEELEESTAIASKRITDDRARLEPELRRLRSMQKRLMEYGAQIDSNVQLLERELDFYQNTSDCPTCARPLDAALRERKSADCRDKLIKLRDGRTKLDAELTETNCGLSTVVAGIDSIGTLAGEVSSGESRARSIRKQIDDIRGEETPHVDDLERAETELSDMKGRLDELESLKSECYRQGSYNDALGEMLKDTGIKTKIIEQYLPVMNRLINQYLAVLDFYVSFMLDENFEEVIRSRHRDEFSYNSFSEGQKARIDLALLFAWRQIARMKNSASTNLLILDETMDSSLDVDGVEGLLKILSTLEEGTNVFVISHKTDLLDGKFSRKLKFEMVGNFSSVAEVNS